MRTVFLRILCFTACSLEAAVFAGDSTSFSPLVANGADFIVRSHKGGPLPVDILESCRLLREELRRMWLGAVAPDAWRPRCEIVLHATRASYLQAVGRNGGQTSGSSLIQFENGRIVARRIDLLEDGQGRISALPHELTHVVLADRFGGRQPPRWLDEGVATMADSTEKRALHQRDCQHALHTGTALRMFDLLALDQLTSARQIPAFYGQSLSLVRFLAEQDEPQKVVVFSEVAMKKGYDHALQQCYGLDGVIALERKWRGYAMATRQRSTRVPVTTISQRP